MRDLTVREATPADGPAVAAIHDDAWGGPTVVGHGVLYDLPMLPTLVAVDPAGTVTGVLAYAVADDALEVVSIAAVRPGRGAGTALLTAVVDEARRRGLRRLWLVTTNDNLRALRFYQRRGLRIVGVRPGAVDDARRLKPGIPQVGAYGIPLHDELILELHLD
jgi:ribosomal protein S18 acetylase RimI-like enzyme